MFAVFSLLVYLLQMEDHQICHSGRHRATKKGPLVPRFGSGQEWGQVEWGHGGCCEGWLHNWLQGHWAQWGGAVAGGAQVCSLHGPHFSVANLLQSLPHWAGGLSQCFRMGIHEKSRFLGSLTRWHEAWPSLAEWPLGEAGGRHQCSQWHQTLGFCFPINKPWVAPAHKDCEGLWGIMSYTG